MIFLFSIHSCFSEKKAHWQRRRSVLDMSYSWLKPVGVVMDGQCFPFYFFLLQLYLLMALFYCRFVQQKNHFVSLLDILFFWLSVKSDIIVCHNCQRLVYCHHCKYISSQVSYGRAEWSGFHKFSHVEDMTKKKKRIKI